MAKSTRTATGVLDAHRDAGETFTAGGLQSFLRTEGDGEPVVCIHGMPGSSFGYRVVHDTGGPAGFELAAACPGRVLSLTILNTVVDVTGRTPPWTMRPFRWPVAGELWAAGMVPPAFRFLMKLQGTGDFSQVSKAEINTCRTLMKGDDRGRTFL